jgi:hypothetical protein
MRVQYVETIPIPEALISNSGLGEIATTATRSASERTKIAMSIYHRLLTDLAAPNTKLSRKLKNFHTLDFGEFRAEVKRAVKADIPLKERADWESLFNTAKAEVIRLSSEIAAAEREIDRLVYAAFELTADEIALLEQSLEGQV